jgi:SGNH hydrolase-like domain, acetyltransferase AlgX
MRRWWQLGNVLPTMMMAVFAINFALCFTTLDWLPYRTWEAALVEPGTETQPGKFAPGRAVQKSRAFGDLANMGNFVDMREYRAEDFRADEFGFRNDPFGNKTNFMGVVVGDSFVVGPDEPESLTLPGQLTQLSGGYFYNAGGPEATAENVLELTSRLHLVSGIIVYELLERKARSFPPGVSLPGSAATVPQGRFHVLLSDIEATWKSAKATLPAPVRFVARRIKLSFDSVSPAAIVSQRTMKRIENDAWLPNPYAKAVLRQRLNNGADMLFILTDRGTAENVDALAASWGSYLASFSARMAERDFSTIVLLVPNKYTVYEPLLVDQSPSHSENVLERIEGELRRTGTPVVNVTTSFQTAAAQELARGRYLYWRDDTHWNSLGINIAATQLVEQFKGSRSSAAMHRRGQ